MKRFSLVALALVLACNNPVGISTPTTFTEDELLGNWMLVKYDFYYMDGPELEQGTEYYNSASTYQFLRFAAANVAYRYNQESDTTFRFRYSYSASAQKFSSESYDFRIDRKSDTLIIIDEFYDPDYGYEKEFYVQYSGPVPPYTWPETVVDRIAE